MSHPFFEQRGDEEKFLHAMELRECGFGRESASSVLPASGVVSVFMSQENVNPSELSSQTQPFASQRLLETGGGTMV